MDKLKEFLRLHRAGLDVDSPADDAWERISSEMGSGLQPPGSATGSGFLGSRRISRWVTRYVAAACLIALAGAGAWLHMKDRRTPNGAGGISQGGGVARRGGVARHDSIAGGGAVARPGDVAGGRGVEGSRSTAGPSHKARLRKPDEADNAIAAIDKSYSTLIDYQLKKLRATPLYAESGSYFSFYLDQFKQMDRDEQQIRNDIKAYGLMGEFLDQLINVYQQKLNLLKNLQTEINKMNNKVIRKEAPSQKTEVHYLNI